MTIEDAPVVKVLDFDEAEAYNPDRPISSLIRTQLLHLHHAENLIVPVRFRTNININNLLTERQASDYIHKITQLLHRYGKLGSARKSTVERGGTPTKVATKLTKKTQTQDKQRGKSTKRTRALVKKASKAPKRVQSTAQKADRKKVKKTARNMSKPR